MPHGMLQLGGNPAKRTYIYSRNSVDATVKTAVFSLISIPPGCSVTKTFVTTG